MPNQITNRLTIINLRSDDPGFRKYISRDSNVMGSEDYIDFEKVIPIPEEIQDIDKKYNEEYGIPGITMMSEELYEWCVKNWNTKWNSYYLELDASNDVEFSTAWSNCFNVIIQMSIQNPYWIIEVKYYDENLGDNLGVYYVNNGNVLDEYYPNSHSVEAYSLLHQKFDIVVEDYWYDDSELTSSIPPIEYEIFYNDLSMDWEIKSLEKSIMQSISCPIEYF